MVILLPLYAAILALCGAILDDVLDGSQLLRDIAALKAKTAALEGTVNFLQKQLDATSDLAAAAAASPHHDPVAFTAHLTTTIASLPDHHHVPFDNVIANLGDAYNKTTGHFRSPAFGVYGFFLTATNIPGHSVSLTLMLNGQDRAYVLAHGSAQTPGQWETSSTAVVLTLKAGDEVWAQNENNFSAVEELDGSNYSTFTGFLIQAL